jgi:hypothetical protein
VQTIDGSEDCGWVIDLGKRQKPTKTPLDPFEA